MQNPYRHLPPLTALVGFEAAARLGSFSRAASELNMTQSAVSHQIRSLETQLGQPLFLRINRRVELTDAGHDLLNSAQMALDGLRQGLRRLEAYSKPGSVVLHMPPALGTLWYLPRLPSFRSKHPQIDPWLHTAEESIDLAESEVDISLTFEPPLGGEILCAPILNAPRMALAHPDLAHRWRSDLADAPLIHDEQDDGWQDWFLGAGISRTECAKGLNFSDIAMAIDAGARGLGLVLCAVPLVQAHIAAGALEIVHPYALPTRTTLFAVTMHQNLQRDDVRCLWNWLISQADASVAHARTS